MEITFLTLYRMLVTGQAKTFKLYEIQRALLNLPMDNSNWEYEIKAIIFLFSDLQTR